MDYAEARAAFFQPRADGAAPAGTSSWSSAARSLRDAIEPIATICFWAEPAYDAYAAEGLDFLQGYVWGRGSVLGEPEGSVVASSFGVFEPGLVAALYDAGRAACPLPRLRAAKERGAVASLQHVLPDVAEAELADAAATLRRGVDAADVSGRPMSAGARALPWPESDLGRLWHACTILREHRGDGHLAACVAAGLTGLEANLLTEMHVGWEPLAYTATRGWSPEAMQAAVDGLTARGLVTGGELGDAGRSLREDLERTTDRLVQPVVDALGGDLPALVERLDGWAQKIVDAGWFPPDPYKRASG